jgi:hypothetical protein
MKAFWQQQQQQQKYTALCLCYCCRLHAFIPRYLSAVSVYACSPAAAAAAAFCCFLQDKILQSMGRGHEVTVTNDGATILKSVYVDNPAAKVLQGAAGSMQHAPLHLLLQLRVARHLSCRRYPMLYGSYLSH